MRKKSYIILGSLVLLFLSLQIYVQAYESKYIRFEKDLGEDIYVVNTNYTSKLEEDYQIAITKKIENKTKKKMYTFENPLLLYNPYGTNTLSLNIYFESDESVTLSYTIQAEGTEDFSRTLYEEDTRSHALQIIGLVPEKENTILLTLTYEDGRIETKEIQIKVPALDTSTNMEIQKKKGESMEEMSDGLFAVLGHDKNFNANIYLFDNNGTIRSELVLNSYRADRILFIGDYILYPSSKQDLILVDRTGKIRKQYHLDNYEMHHDLQYDEKNNKVLILTNLKEDTTIEDRVISLDLSTSEVKEVLNFKKILPNLYERAVMPSSGKNSYGGTALDWIHLNSLEIVEDDLLVSSRELSTIIKIDSIYENPTLSYMIADASVYENTSMQDKLLTKVGDFVDSAGQHSLVYEKGEDGIYYISLYNNNYKGANTRPTFDWSAYPGTGTYNEGEKSMYYKYKINEKEGTYELVTQLDLPYSSIVSSVQNYQNHIITSSGKSNEFREYDSKNQLISSYTYEAETYAYRVFKYDFNHFWFQN